MAFQSACEVLLPDQPMDCCFSSNAPLIASALVTGQVLVHRYQQADNTADAEQHGTRQECTSYSAEQLLSRSSSKGASCRAITFTQNGNHLVCGFETGSILQLDAGTGKVVTRLTAAHQAGINRVLAIPQQQSLVAVGDENGLLCLWDLRQQKTLITYKKHTDFITGLTVADKQQAFVAVSGDGTLSVHDLRSNKALAHSETDADDELLSVVVVKHGKKLVCGSQSGVLALWSWGYWNDCSDRFPGHPESVDAIVTFDEDTVITGSSDGALRVINILPNKLIGVVGEHADDMPVERLAVSADRRVLASTSHDNSVKLWDLSVLHDNDESEWTEADDDAEVAEQQQGANSQTAAAGRAVAPAAAAAAANQPSNMQQHQAASREASGINADSASHSGDSDSGAEGGKKQKRRKHEKTAMTKGRNKSKKESSNFFADLL